MTRGSDCSCSRSEISPGQERGTARLLGTEPYHDAAYYVGFRVGDQEMLMQ
jgi:hypothetical protein